MSVEGLARSLDSPRSPVEGGRGLLAPLADSAHRGAGRQARLIQGRVGIIVALRLEPRLPGSGPRAAPASDGVGGRGGVWGRQGQLWHTQGLRGAGGGVCRQLGSLTWRLSCCSRGSRRGRGRCCCTRPAVGRGPDPQPGPLRPGVGCSALAVSLACKQAQHRPELRAGDGGGGR